MLYIRASHVQVTNVSAASIRIDAAYVPDVILETDILLRHTSYWKPGTRMANSFENELISHNILQSSVILYDLPPKTFRVI